MLQVSSPECIICPHSKTNPTKKHRKVDVERMIYELHPPTPVIYEDVFIFVDPAAGGPGSDYGIMSVTRSRGVLAVSFLVFTNKPGSSVARSRGVLAVSF